MAESFLFTYRRATIIAVHLALWTAAFAFAFFLRFEFSIPKRYFPEFWTWLVVLLAARTTTGFVFASFQGLWRYTGASDLVALFKATTLSSLVFVFFIVISGTQGFPRSIFVIEWLTTMMLVGGLRFGIRKMREVASEIRARSSDRQRVLIIGAGDAGEMLSREIGKSHGSKYVPVGFLDDDSKKRGMRIHGLPVLGRIEDVAAVVARYEIDEVVIAIPSASGSEMRRILEQCRPTQAVVRTIPGLDQLIDGRVSVNQIREVAIEDLLGRTPVALDEGALVASFRGAVVLVSGAGGSIGSELCHQVARFQPKALVLVERAENNLFQIHRALVAAHPSVVLHACVADVTDAHRMESIFALHRPDVVLHAAAHKHVPMMEANPGEAVKNNVVGTQRLAQIADRFGAKRFVMISTDKAVNPTSVMGASKRLAEMYVQALAEKSSTKFIAVRFGNVLGSAGSVIPIFQEQIKRGGPVTVTHKEMRRYFMTIPEASQLVLQAGAMGDGGEVFILDMGEPVRIIDLARDLIRLSGFVPGIDIAIEVTGLRPGEKLFEELSVDEEHAARTKHPKIFIGQARKNDLATVARALDALAALADEASSVEIKKKLRELVPEYTIDEGALATDDEKPATAAEEPPAARVIPLRR